MIPLLDPDSISSTLVPISCLGLTYGAWKYIQAKRSPLNAIPTIGHSGVLTSYITAFKWFKHATEIIQEGYDQYPNQAFKVATISKWVVVLNGKQHMEDIRKAPEDVVSFRRAVAELTQNRYTLGRRFDDDPYHVAAIRTPFTRNLAYRFDDIMDEITESFKDYVPFTEDWNPISPFTTAMHIICRTSNRYFVGLPLCRDPGYRSLNETFTRDVAISADIINCFPDFLKPLVGQYMTTVPNSVKRALDYLGPMLEERLEQEKEHGDHWAERPNDLITWLLENATQDHHRTIRDLVLRILTVNFASLNSSAMAFTHSLFDLAIHPEYVEEMRKEAETVIEQERWTKGAMQKLRKIDSFLKESQRLNSLGGLVMARKTLKDWTLSDGTRIPAGTFFGIASDAMNKEERSFPDAHTFKGFRFAEMHEEDGDHDSAKHQMVSISPEQVAFGYGRHACPGRFFAVNEIKAIFTYMLLNYDVQLENRSMERPANHSAGQFVVPNMGAKVMFRKRRA